MSFVAATEGGGCSNGTCDGIFGLLQSGEGDLVMHPLPLDKFDDFTLDFADALYAGDEYARYIATAINSTNEYLKVDLIQSLSVFSPMLVAMFMLANCLAILVLKIFTNVSWWNQVWSLYRTIVQQLHTWNSGFEKYVFFRMFVLTIVVSSFFYTSIGLNLISTELVAAVPIHFVNSIEDLANAELKLLFMNGSGTADNISKSESKVMSQIWKKSNKRISGDLQEVARLLETFDYAMIENAVILELVQYLQCLSKIDEGQRHPANKMYISKNGFAKERSTTSVRRSNDLRIREMARRFVKIQRSLMELGVSQRLMERITIETVSEMFAGGDSNMELKLEKCVENKVYMKQRRSQVKIVTFESIRRLLMYLILVAVFITVVFCFEKCIWRL